MHLPLVPWNKGKLVGAKKPLKAAEVHAIRDALEKAGKLRELTLFNLAIDSKLRGCDLVRMKISDVLTDGYVRSRSSVIQKKTGRPVQFEITPRTQETLVKWLAQQSFTEGRHLFPSRQKSRAHVSARQYARIVKSWIRLAGLDIHLYGTHTMRRTKAAHIYRSTGNLRAVQLLLGHKNIESTVRYLGIEMEDALDLSEQLDL